LETTSARLHFTTTTKPAVLTGASADPDGKEDTEGAAGSLYDAEYRYLIMPVRLSG
jgi:DNA polymerase-3 subunit beta